MYELLANIDGVFHQPDGFQPGIALIPLLMAALGALFLNAITDTSDALKMTGNFCTLFLGATIAVVACSLLRLPGDVMIIACFASAAGMSVAAILSIAILKPI